MDSEKKISPAVINRLPRYYRYLGDLLESDITAHFFQRTQCKDEYYSFSDSTRFE